MPRPVVMAGLLALSSYLLSTGDAFLVRPAQYLQPASAAAAATHLAPPSSLIVKEGAATLSMRDRRSIMALLAEGKDGEVEAVGTDVPFELRGFSLATIGLVLGGTITVGSFAEYLLSSGSEGLSGVGFVYGIPILLIGLALKYAQLDPVPVESTPEGDRIFARKATPTITKIKKDVTRHRYGDDAHLDTTVQALGLVIPNKEFPQLQYIKQAEEDGELAFSMVFKSDETPYRMWAEPERIQRYERFFGPGVRARVEKVDAVKRLVAITLLTGEAPAAAAAEGQGGGEEAAAKKQEQEEPARVNAGDF